MSQVKFYSGLKSQLDKKPVENGALYITTDTHELYADLNNNRNIIGNINVDNIKKEVLNYPTNEELLAYLGL